MSHSDTVDNINDDNINVDEQNKSIHHDNVDVNELKLSYNDNFNGYYVRIKLDILDDMFCYDFIVKFDDIPTAKIFKSKYENSDLKQHFWLSTSKCLTTDEIWLKQYHNVLLKMISDENYVNEFNLKSDCSKIKIKNDFTIIHDQTDKMYAGSVSYGFPNSSTQIEDIDGILNIIQECWNKFKLTYRVDCKMSNDKLVIIPQDIYACDENQLVLYTKNPELSESKKVDRQTYKNIIKSTARLSADTTDNPMYFLATNIDMLVHYEKTLDYKMMSYQKLYDIAHERCQQHIKIFDQNILNFTNNKEILEIYDENEIDEMNKEIKKIDEQFKIYQRSLSFFKSKFIMKKMNKHIEELEKSEELEKQGLI